MIETNSDVGLGADAGVALSGDDLSVIAHERNPRVAIPIQRESPSPTGNILVDQSDETLSIAVDRLIEDALGSQA